MDSLDDVKDYVLIGESLIANEDSKKYVNVDELRQSAIELHKKLEEVDCPFSHNSIDVNVLDGDSCVYCVDCDKKITNSKEWREEHMKKNHLVLWDAIQVHVLLKFLKRRYNLTENDVVAHAGE